MDYKFFIDPKMKTSKCLIYKCDSLPIETVLITGHVHANSIENYNICIERHKSVNLIQIRLSNVRDNTSVFICTIDNAKFEQFKMEQSLYVTFESFVNHITEMIEKCRTKQINVVITTDNEINSLNPAQPSQLQFYEKGTFKHLVHVSLPIIPAPHEVILFHINHTYAHLQEENKILIQKNVHFQAELLQKNEQIDQLNSIINGMRTTLNDQEKFLNDRHKENVIRLEHEKKNVTDMKNQQIRELEKQIETFKSRVDHLNKENVSLSDKVKMENKQMAQLRIDFKKALNKIAEQDKHLDGLTNDRKDHQNLVQKNDQVLFELRKQNTNLEHQIAICEKQKQELMAELQAEKNICQIKKDGLKIATEDICNANTIIRRQAAEINALRKKVELRTEVALKQEQVIRETGKGKDGVGNLVEKMDENLIRISQENRDIHNKVEWITDRTNTLESKYRDRIDDLYDRIQTMLPFNRNG